MKINSQYMMRERQRAFDLLASLTLLTLVGVYLGTWLILVILKAVLD
jgi:hypothetical protein